MISLKSVPFINLNTPPAVKNQPLKKKINPLQLARHQYWDHGSGWKNTLNNLRLIIQPILLLWCLFPWLELLPDPRLLLGLNALILVISRSQPFYSSA